MSPLFHRIVGPRAPEGATDRGRYLIPGILLTVAAVLLVASMPFPYWHMDLMAPQYPKGLELTAWVNHMEGDIRELDSLNHYIGMRPLAEAAQLEMSVAVYAVSLMAILAVLATTIHTRWAALISLPAILFPGLFLADMWWTMRDFGLNLDPKAPLSSTIKPFVPTILGPGKVAQFETYATVQAGFWMALAASVLVVVGLWFHRRAWKPLVDKEERESAAREAGAL